MTTIQCNLFQWQVQGPRKKEKLVYIHETKQKHLQFVQNHATSLKQRRLHIQISGPLRRLAGMTAAVCLRPLSPGGVCCAVTNLLHPTETGGCQGVDAKYC